MEYEKNDEKRPQFGMRYLIDEDNVFQHNAWDNVPWDDEQERVAKEKIAENSKCTVDEEKQMDFEENSCKYWNAFYDTHRNRFFKDRNWLFTEFPELESIRKLKILEIGCGVGNTMFPILRHIQKTDNDDIFVYGCDFSETAIAILKKNNDYDESRCCGFVCDATSNSWNTPFNDNSIDVVLLIFTLSAMHPEKFSLVVRQIKKYLKPGGIVLFRDYGRFDMAQLRFKNGHCLADNFYVRGDGTRVYFFTQNEVKELFESEGFQEEQNLMDRRLQVNRGKMLKMYRVWIQAKYRKPIV